MTRLKHERRTRKMSQVRLGLDVRIPQPTLSQIERGRLLPTEEQRSSLALFLGIPPEDLLKEVVVVEVRV